MRVASRLEPLRERIRNLLHRRGHNDAVEIAGIGGDVKTIPQLHLDISTVELRKPSPGTVGERPVTLDGHDMTGKSRQNGGLVAGAGTDLEHAVVLLELQLFRHIGHHEGLADGLPTGDSQRAVAVGIVAIGRLDEHLARNLLHGAKHPLIADAAPPQAELKHHLLRWILRCGHFGPVKSIAGRRLAKSGNLMP
jgi:hypothetical protein